MEKLRERNNELDLNDYSPKEIVDKLIEEYRLSGFDLQLQLERAIQNNGGDLVSPEKFRDTLYEQLKFVGLSRGFIDQLFNKLDPKKTQKVSLRHLLSLVYGEGKETLLKLPNSPEDLLQILSEAGHEQFTSKFQFATFCRHKHESQIEVNEFIIFVTSFTRLKQKDAIALFNFLDDARCGFLLEGQILSIWDHLDKNKTKELQAIADKSRENEQLKSFEISGIGGMGEGPQLGFGRQGSAIEGGLGDKNEDVAQDDLHEFTTPAGSQVRMFQDEIEELVMRIGRYAIEMIRDHGKNFKELYQMFADKVTKMMNFDEFQEAAKFITKDKEIDEQVLRSLYLLLAWPQSKKITLSRFITMIELGKKVNSVYVKLKKKYGNKTPAMKPLFVDELNKLNVKRADGFIPLLEVRRLFAVNKMDLLEFDCEILKEQGILIQKDRVNVINVQLFLQKAFQEQSEVTAYLKRRSGIKILLRFRTFLKNRDKRKAADDALKNIFGLNDSAATKSRASPIKLKPKTLKKSRLAKTIEEKMASLLPDPKTSTTLGSVHYQKMASIVEKILLEILDSAVHQGENNLLKKNVQRRYANRSVNKDNIVLIQEETFAVSDILPRSLSSIATIGRIFFMNNDATLSQYDLANAQMLPNIDLNSKIPMKKDELMDYLLDPESGLLYILKVSWILEAWNIYQKSKAPASKLKLAQVADGPGLLAQSYKNRYLGAFPKLMSLSQNSRQYLVLNCTMVNGTVYFLDPISLSILNQTKLRDEDLSIKPHLNRIFFQLKPLFTGLAKNQQTFDKLFEADLRLEGKSRVLPVARLRKYLLEDLPSKPLIETDFDDLVRFVDTNGDGCIGEEEWAFLAESVRLASRKNTVHASYEIPAELKDIDKNVAKIFYEIYDFVQKKGISIEEMFKIFDANGSGRISESEFIEILSEISKETNLDNKRRFFKFVDKDNSRQIDVAEFIGVFKMFGKYSPAELLPSEVPRTDFFVVIEKAFEHGIDIEQEFVRLDEFKDGGIETHRFRFLLRSLPFGVTDSDVNHYIEKQLQFTNDGCINYLDIFSNERYKRIKLIYQVKRGLKDPVDLGLKSSEDAEKFEGQQKIIVESVIHLSSEDVFIYTLVSPKTSTIFLAKSRRSDSTDKHLSERFEAQLLARLIGHRSKEPPTILYVNESGCLISGEKLPTLKDALNDLGQPSATFTKSNESFNRFYTNISNNKTRVASIFIWNLARELFAGPKVNPPWKISPSRVIENAHYDSIVCLSYMPLCQLLVSSSVDGSIKLWDPTARPHSLVHKDASQKIKAGYYARASEELTQSNQPFSEVGRFYTGELTCYALVCQHQRVPVADHDGVARFRSLEYLIALELGKAQRSGGRLRTEGLVKIFGVERITMEIPVSRFEEPLPKQLWSEVVDLAIANRQSSKFLFRRNLSTSLDKIMSRVVIQKTELAKVASLLKTITLERFNGTTTDQKTLELFDLLALLPIRNADSHPRLLSIDEVHMHLKRNNYLFPSKMSKDAFVKVVQELIQKSSHYLVDHRSKNQNKFLNDFSQKIAKKEIDIDLFFSKDIYTREDLKKIFEPLADKQEEVEDLLTDLDPFYSNTIKLDTLKTFFASEIISSKISEFARPNVIISQINAKLSRTNKVDLLRNLFGADSQGIGKVGMVGFIQAFSRLSRSIDENLLKELFLLMSEDEDGELFLDLSYFCKKLLTHSEHFELARVYNALAKIKNSLRFRLKSLEDLFVDEDTDFKGKSIQNMTVRVAQFMAKVRELDIVGLSNRELSLISNFLSTVDEDGNSCISLLNLSAYFKKIELKYQFTNLADYKVLIKELKKLLAIKEEFCRKWQGMCNRELIGYGEMRILLNHFNVSEEIIDLILLKFVELETSQISFFNKVQAFIEMNSFLEDSANLKEQNAKALASKLFEEQEKIKSSLTEIERPKDPIDILIDMLEKYENKKTILNALTVCKKFDRDSTGRINVADFVNILWFNLEFSKQPESESVMLNFQNEFIVKNNLKTIEYSEIFDKLESRRAARLTKTSTELQLNENPAEEIDLTEIIGKITNKLRASNFNIDKALAFFDRDGCGLVVQESFRKIIRWTKVELTEEEQTILEDTLMFENAINYRKFLDLLEIDNKHINVQFNADIWFAISKNFSLDLFEKLNLNIEYLKYFHNLKKDPNPLVSATVLHQMLQEFKELGLNEIDKIVKYAVAGSINSLTQALQKLERTDLKWEYEYVHMPFFLTSVPAIVARKRDLPENKDTNRGHHYQKDTDESEKNHIISKVKGMLRERGVTMWESLISSASELIEGSKIAKNNFLRMLRMIDLDLTVKEKVLILKVLDPTDTGKIELNRILETFEPGSVSNQKVVQDSILLERLIYGIYYGGHSLVSAFEVIDEAKSGMVSRNEFVHGISKLDLSLSVFEINHILDILELKDQYSRITKYEFKRILKKLMKKFNINPTKSFSFSLFARIKNLTEKKNKNLRESFVEEDLHKSGYADLDMLRRALLRFGLDKIKIHEIKTLVKLFKKDVNAAADDGPESEDEESEKNDDTLNLSAALETKKPKANDKAKLFDVDDPNFRIDYYEFVRRIYEELENNSQTMIQGAYQIFRKVYNMTRIKDFTLFEAFVYFDVNNQNTISKMQLKIGLQNLNIILDQLEMESIWNIFEKNKDSKVTFTAFFNAFLNAGCVDVIRFDEKVTKLVKKFCLLITKHGNLEEIFRKFDINQNGAVKLDEFKATCEKLHLDFKEEELTEAFRIFCNPEELNPQLKKKRKTDLEKSQNDSKQEDETALNSYRSFNFKKFVTVISFFRKKEHLLKLLHRFDSITKERGMSYQKIFDDYWNQFKEKKKGSASTTALNKPGKAGGKGGKPEVKSINMTELKVLLKNLKLSFSDDELNMLCDAFEVETISASQMDAIIKAAVESIEKDKNDKAALFLRIAKEIENAIQSKNSSLQKVFFEFDARSDGSLKLDEFNEMLNFLQVRVNKTEVKKLFEEMDYDKKGTVTIKEFQSFFDQTFFNKQKKDEKAEAGSKTNSQLDAVIKKMQEFAVAKQTSLEKVIHSQNIEANQIVSLKALEKVLLKMDCVLKREELAKVMEAASRDQSCSWSDLIDWGIKNNIDFRTKEKVFSQFPPAVQVILSKILQIFKKMDLSIETAFKYFSNQSSDLSMRNEFLTLVQGLQVQTNEEELIGLYNFFDERNYGEISKTTFIEKCEIARDFYKWSDNLADPGEKKGLTTLTLRQHVMTILEKLYVSFLERNYNKKQIFAVFDKHGNGIISRDEFLRICENLGFPIQPEYRTSLLNFLDPTENQPVNLTTLINKMEESVPDNAKDSLKYSQAQGILREIVTKLDVFCKEFLGEFLDLEKKLQINDILNRTKTGVAMYDFYRLLTKYGIRLQESEKMIMNAAFKNKRMSDYFNTEALYLSFDKLSSDFGLMTAFETENLEAWESTILRRVADRLRSMNMSLEKAFSSIHTNNLGFIKIVDFKQLLFSLDINLSQKDVDLLIKRLANSNNPNVISFDDFKQRFWACFFEGKSLINPLNIDNRSRQIAAMVQNKIRFEMKMPLSYAWDKLDRQKVGVATLEDLKEFLLEIKMPITKEDLGFLFTLIDQGQDSQIDQFEFVEFWNLNLAADFETKKKKIKKFETDVIGQIVKKLNQSGEDLFSLFKSAGTSKSEYLDERQLNLVFSKLGLNFNDDKVREIMKLINTNNPERVSFDQFETALLRNGLKPKGKKDEVKVDFNDKVLTDFLNALNVTANKLKVKVSLMVRDYDEDYDGFLTTHEFYNLIRALEKNFKLEEIQRLAHHFASPTSPNKIVIDNIIQAQTKQEKIEAQLFDNLCDPDAFKAILENFDPTLILFKRWGKLKQAKIRFEKYLESHRDKIRG